MIAFPVEKERKKGLTKKCVTFPKAIVVLEYELSTSTDLFSCKEVGKQFYHAPL